MHSGGTQVRFSTQVVDLQKGSKSALDSLLDGEKGGYYICSQHRGEMAKKRGVIEKGGGKLYTLWASVRVQPSVRAVLELWEQSASIWPAHLDEDAMGEDREFEG